VAIEEMLGGTAEQTAP